MPDERAVVQVRLTARDKKRVEALAAKDQMTVSEFVRRLIRRELGEVPSKVLQLGEAQRRGLQWLTCQITV